MTRRRELQGQATVARGTRRKDVRARQASRVLATTDWLRDTLVDWTGRREDIPALDGAITPIRVVLQNRLADLPAGFYAVRIRPPADAAQSRLQLDVAAVEAVTRDLLARTARAIEAVSKFPKAATRFIGSVGPWCEAARRTLDERRVAVEQRRAWRIGAEGGVQTASSLRDRLAACYADERHLDPASAPATVDERAALAVLLDTIDAVRREPARRFLMIDPAIGFIRPAFATTPLIRLGRSRPCRRPRGRLCGDRGRWPPPKSRRRRRLRRACGVDRSLQTAPPARSLLACRALSCHVGP